MRDETREGALLFFIPILRTSGALPVAKRTVGTSYTHALSLALEIRQ